jgi:glycosyltransferase involved in cell wall biosynthesis
LTSNLKPTRGGWVYAGRLSEEKGLLKLLENWPRGEILQIFGSGPLESVVLSKQSPNIVFRGFRPPEEILKALSVSEGLVFPSLMVENSPLSYIQALSVGTPVLALRENSVGDDVAEFGTGKIVPSWSELGESMREIRQDANIHDRCVRRFEENFSAEVWTERIEDLYSGLLA